MTGSPYFIPQTFKMCSRRLLPIHLLLSVHSLAFISVKQYISAGCSSFNFSPSDICFSPHLSASASQWTSSLCSNALVLLCGAFNLRLRPPTFSLLYTVTVEKNDKIILTPQQTSLSRVSLYTEERELSLMHVSKRVGALFFGQYVDDGRSSPVSGSSSF